MKRGIIVFAIALAATVGIATIATQFSSSEPDGLVFVSAQEGFDETAEVHDLADAPLADYGGNLDGAASRNVAVAGLIGVGVTLVLGFGVFWLVRAGNPDRREPASR